MNTTEFSNEFDVLYNNIMSNQAPGLDDYEKSVFLTKAQSEIIRSYFAPELNKSLKGFDDTQRRQIDFSSIITVKEFGKLNNPTSINRVSEDGKIYKFPTDCLYVINESLQVKGGPVSLLQVIPINYSEYSRQMMKPYKQPLKTQAWRLLTGVSSSSGVAQIIAHSYDTSYGDYKIRYIRKPRPIILSPLQDETIDGYAGCNSNNELVVSNAVKGCECELDSSVHQEILQRAIELAKAAYTGDLSSQIALGQSSETNMGIVSQQK